MHHGVLLTRRGYDRYCLLNRLRCAALEQSGGSSGDGQQRTDDGGRQAELQLHLLITLRTRHIRAFGFRVFTVKRIAGLCLVRGFVKLLLCGLAEPLPATCQSLRSALRREDPSHAKSSQSQWQEVIRVSRDELTVAHRQFLRLARAIVKGGERHSAVLHR